MPALTLHTVFQRCDKNNDGAITKIELIQICRSDPEVANFFGLPDQIRQEDGSRDMVEAWWRDVDLNDDRLITEFELSSFYSRTCQSPAMCFRTFSARRSMAHQTTSQFATSPQAYQTTTNAMGHQTAMALQFGQDQHYPAGYAASATTTSALNNVQASMLYGTQQVVPGAATPRTMMLGNAVPLATQVPYTPRSMVLGSQVVTRQVSGTQVVRQASGAQIVTRQASAPMNHVATEPAKVCAKCNVVISGQFGTAAGGFFHPQCMTCDRCHAQLAGPFSMQGGQMVCTNCTELAVCTKCGQMITGEVMQTGEGLKFHPGCFTCDNCQAQLYVAFHNHEGRRLCDGCVPRDTQDTCGKCNLPILGKAVATGDGLCFHPECLTCDICGTVVAGSFNLRNGQRLCSPCNKKNTGKTCTRCGEGIVGGAVTTKDGCKFHPQCLKCDNCSVVLSGPFHLHDGARLCDECVPSQECKTCQKCGVWIDGQYVTVSDGVFLHPECFTCAACSKPLSGIRLFRSVTSGLAFCSEGCHQHGAVATGAVSIATMGRMGTTGTMAPAMSMPRAAEAHISSREAPVVEPAAIIEPDSDSEAAKKKSPKKSKQGLCCS